MAAQSEAISDIRLSITPDLYDALSSLVRVSTQVDLPQELDQAVRDGLLEYGQVNQKEDGQSGDVLSKNTSTADTVHTVDRESKAHAPASTSEAYISRSTLVRISQWMRNRKAHRAVERAGLDTRRYSLIALCAGTKTYTTAAQERLIKADPDAASHFLPFHLARSSSSTMAKRTKSDASSSLGAEYRSASKEISAVLNVLFSIGGVGGAVFVVAKTSAGMRQETAIVLAFLAAIVVGFAETWLYIAHSRRSRKLYAEGEKVRLETESQSGPTPVEILDAPVDLDNDGAQTTLLGETKGLAPKEGNTHQTARQQRGDLPNHFEVRLRRKPLGAS